MKKLFTLIAFFLFTSVSSFAYITITNDINSTTTWTSGNTYFVANWIDIMNDNTLTIEDGVVVKFGNSVGITTDWGTLNLAGQSSSHVIFTSMNDNSVGETIAGSTGTPNPGDWWGIEITHDDFIPQYPTDGTANISYADFRYGTKLKFSSQITSSIDHTTIQQFSDYGLYVENNSPYDNIVEPLTADNVDVSYCENGIYLSICKPSNYTNIWLHNISDAEILSLDFCEIDDMSSWNITGNTGQYIYIEGLTGNNQIMNFEPLVYVLGGYNSSYLKNITIQEGCIIKMVSGKRISIDDGTLQVNGTESKPVIFTSYRDDEFGGDTNGDGANTLPAKGDWGGIFIDGTNSSTYAKAQINWAWIRYAGSNSGNLEFSGATSPSYIYNSRIEYSESNGIDVFQCSPDIKGNTFLNNDSSDVRILDDLSNPNLGTGPYSKGKNIFRKNDLDILNTTTNDINALYNDWGSEDSTALSQRVGNNDPTTGNVNFYPWYGNDDEYWYSYDKTAIENAGVYGQLIIPYADAPAGTVILYQTGEGRYGKMKILQRSLTSMTLWWETYNDDGTTHSAGTNLSLNSVGDNDLCELDRGVRGTYLNSQDDCEFYINADGSLITMPNAKFLTAYSYCTPTEHSGGTSGNETWITGTHYITGNFTIYGGDTLFIEPGAVVKFATGKELTTYGAIMALGTQADSIWFTSENDDLHGCIIDASTGNPQPGDWGNISMNGYYEKRGKFRFCNFAYGGAGSSGMISYSGGGNGFVKQCTVENSSSSGLFVYQSDMTVDSSTFKLNSNHGIEYNYYSTVRVNNSSFINNGNYAVITGSSEIEPCENNQASGNNVNGIVIVALGTSGSTHLINYNSIPFVFMGTPYINSGQSLYVGGGNGHCVVKFAPGAGIYLNGGYLHTFATTFTSLKDDSEGGDTNNDGSATSPAPGDWGNIHIYNNKNAMISQTTIKYGGNSTAALYFSGSAGGTLDNSYVEYSQNHGVYTGSGYLDIWASHLLDNEKSGIYIYQSDSTQVRNSYIENNAENGISVYYSSPLEISGNYIENNGGYPVFYNYSQLKTPITENVFEGNLMDAVVVENLTTTKKQSFFEITKKNASNEKDVYISLNNCY